MRRTVAFFLLAAMLPAPAAATAACVDDARPGCCCRAAGNASKCDMPCDMSPRRAECPDDGAMAAAPAHRGSLQEPAAAADSSPFLSQTSATPAPDLAATSPRAPPGAPLYLRHHTFLL